MADKDSIPHEPIDNKEDKNDANTGTQESQNPIANNKKADVMRLQFKLRECRVVLRRLSIAQLAEMTRFTLKKMNEPHKSVTKAANRNSSLSTTVSKLSKTAAAPPSPSGRLTRQDIRDGEWLTDTEISMFLEKLKGQFPGINGLEDPILVKNQPYSLPKHEVFVRVVISRDNHWVCIVGGQFIEGEDVCLYDSLSRIAIDCVLGETLAATVVIRDFATSLMVRLQRTQRQKENVCGFFALANATAICYGIDPEMIMFDEVEIREHYIGIVFDNKPFSMFPYTPRKKYSSKNHRLLEYEI